MDYSGFKIAILERLRTQLPQDLHYHNLAHTESVLVAAVRLAEAEAVHEADRNLLYAAVLLHDAGFINGGHDNHESCSCDLAGEMLPTFGFSSEQVEVIQELIMATRIPQTPKTKLAQILCDADLDYLGTDRYTPIANALGRELMAYGRIPDEVTWLKIQVSFLSQHRYFTETARNTRRATKVAHFTRLEAQLGLAGRS